MRVGTVQIYALLAIVSIGIYILPNAVATFAGSHSMEFNESEGLYELRCTKCHGYITSELGATSLSLDVMSAHRSAAENSNYVGSGGEINISKAELPLVGGAMVNVCLMCHMVEQQTLSIRGSHTKLTIRVCTDEDCHGNSTAGTGSSIYTDAGNVGQKISNSTDMHSGWYTGMESMTSNYVREEGTSNYSSGFYACMACHTHGAMNMRIERPQAFDVNITINSSGLNIGGPTMNGTSLKETYAQRPFGSVWS